MARPKPAPPAVGEREHLDAHADPHGRVDSRLRAHARSGDRTPLREGVTAITLDLRQLTHIDPIGVAVIAFRCRLCKRQGHGFVLIRRAAVDPARLRGGGRRRAAALPGGRGRRPSNACRGARLIGRFVKGSLPSPVGWADHPPTARPSRSMTLPFAVDWPTIASLATAAGTLVLAVATFSSVRFGQRSTRSRSARRRSPSARCCSVCGPCSLPRA